MRTRFRVSLLALLFAFCNVALAKTWIVQVGGTSDYYGQPVLVFAPGNITISAGDAVTFQNMGGTHNVHADDNSFRCANGCDDSGGDGTPSDGWTFTRTFSTPGVIGYHCDVHVNMGMTGTINVTGTVPSIKLGGYLSGNWFDPTPGQSGHGFQFEFTNAPGSTAGTKTLIAIWFVFSPNGDATWIYGQGDWDPTSNTATIPSELYSGAQFPPNFNSADIQALPYPPGWGTLTFTFSDCNNGTASWHSDVLGYNMANDTPIPIQRLTQIDGTICPL